MENETMKQSFISVQNRSLRNRLVANRFKQILAAGALLGAAAAATQPAVAAPEKVVVYQAFQSISICRSMSRSTKGSLRRMVWMCRR